MRRLAAGIAFALFCLAAGAGAAPAAEQGAAAGEHAAGGDEHGAAPHLDLKKLGLQLFNFSVLVAILVFVHQRAGKKALLARHQQFKAELASAAEARAAAAARLEKQERRLAALENEIAAITAGIKQEAEVEKERLIAAAEERARRIREETTFLMEQQIKEAEQQLRREAALLAVGLAEKIVRSSLDGRDQQRLIDSFVGGVATDGGPHPGGGEPPPSGPINGRGAQRSEV